MTTPPTAEPAATPPPEADKERDNSKHKSFGIILRESFLEGNTFTITVLALVTATVLGGILCAFTNSAVLHAPTAGAMISRAWDVASGTYVALFEGSVFNPHTVAELFQQASLPTAIHDGYLSAVFQPLSETAVQATPLILTGLAVALPYQAGLFNIGGQGQFIGGAILAAWLGYDLSLPFFVHVVVCVIGGFVGGAVIGWLTGEIKARTGAHEVIVTIMLNYVAFYLVFYALSEQNLLQAPGSANPKSLPMKESVVLPKLFGDRYNLHLGFLLALIAVAVVWWILNRSSLGFRIRAVGENPAAARSAGIDVGRTYIVVMLISGGLVGLAGVNQVLGTVTSGITVDLDASIGFDAITVALLGRSKPLGILAAGLLFGAFKAGGFAMQASENIPVDIVLVVQSLIVLFIAAPPLIRAIFRLPTREAQ